MKLPQFSLRDLFWLVLVAACLCGWSIQQRAAALRLQQANMRGEKLLMDLAAEQVKTSQYHSALVQQLNSPLAREERAAELETDRANYREAYFYLREFAPKRDPEDL